MQHETHFEERFEGELEADWSWVREAAEAWCVKEGTLHVQTLPGTLWGERNDARNILVRPPQTAAEGLISEVSVYNQPVLQGEQAGLIWYVDDANYVKLVKESLEGSVWIVLAREENDAPALIDKVPIASDSARLRLSLVDGNVTGAYRASDTDDWQTVGACAPLPQAAIRPGIFTHGGPDDTERWVEFSLFGLSTAGR